MTLLDIQLLAKENLKDYLQKYDIVQFEGPSGSGRMYTVKSLIGEYHVLDISKESKDESLQIINNSLFDYHNILSTLDISQNVSISMCPVFSIGVSIKEKNPIEEEKLLLKRLKKLSQPISKLGRITPVIIAIRQEVCNERISNFLRLAIQCLNAREKRIKIVFLSHSTNQLSGVPCVYMPLLSNSDMGLRQILLALKLNHSILEKLSEDEVSFIFNICLNNLTDLTKIVNELNENIISFNNLYDNRDSIFNIIAKSLEKCGITNGKDILIYCSHASKEDTDLTQGDLEYLIGVKQNDLNRDLEATQKLSLVKNQNRYIKIMVDLVKKIAIDKSYDNQYAIYQRFSEMLSYMYPSNYATRFKFAINIDKEKGAIAKTQFILQQIRHRHTQFDVSDLSEYLQVFIENYGKAVNYCIQKDYIKAIHLLNEYINCKQPIIRAEATLLVAQALMKSLDAVKRTDAVNLLNSIDIDSCDGNLKYRILMCRMSACVHKGNYKDAINDYNRLFAELNNKMYLYPSDELNYNLHVLLRKANMVYNFQAAQGNILLAKNFFKQMENNFTDYFYALCNSLCSNIENMDYNKAKEDIEDFDKLQFKHIDKIFKRQYIFDNNRILYEYFFENQSAKDTADKFFGLFSSMKNYADRYLIANNYAVFLALSGNIKDALSFLEKNASSKISDEEGVYEYRTIINSSIMKFILDNSRRYELIEEINRLKIDKEQPNKSFKEQEIKAVCQAMEKFNCTSAVDWQDRFKSLMPQNKPLNIYEQGFVITPLSNWDDD